MPTDGQKDITKLIVAFLKFTNAPVSQGSKTPAEKKHSTVHWLLNTFKQTPGDGSGVWLAGGFTNVVHAKNRIFV